MGAGDFGAGEGLAGEDVLPDIVPRTVTAPIALRFDGKTRDFLLDDGGRYLSVHPVDQRVALALLILKEKLASAPEVGSGLWKIAYAGGPTLIAEVNDHVRQTLQAMIKAGDIELLAVAVEIPARGTFLVQVDYLNKRLIESERRVLTV